MQHEAGVHLSVSRTKINASRGWQTTWRQCHLPLYLDNSRHGSWSLMSVMSLLIHKHVPSVSLFSKTPFSTSFSVTKINTMALANVPHDHYYPLTFVQDVLGNVLRCQFSENVVLREIVNLYYSINDGNKRSAQTLRCITW